MTVLSIFPKFLKPLALEDLGPRLRDAGLDAVNLIVRGGYWVEPGDEVAGVTRFVTVLRQAGVAVPFCTLCQLPEEILASPDTLAVLADNGISGFRLGYYRWKEAGGSLGQQLTAAHEDLERLTPLLERHQLRAVLQVHHGTLVPSPSCAALVLEGLPDAHFGAMPDVGNMGFEGREIWSRCAQVLGPYWSALGVKDTHIVRTDDVPAPRFCPCMDGDSDWAKIAEAYAGSPGRDRDPWVLQPFYHDDNVEAHLQVLTDEVAFIKSHMRAAGLEV